MNMPPLSEDQIADIAAAVDPALDGADLEYQLERLQAWSARKEFNRHYILSIASGDRAASAFVTWHDLDGIGDSFYTQRMGLEEARREFGARHENELRVHFELERLGAPVPKTYLWDADNDVLVVERLSCPEPINVALKGGDTTRNLVEEVMRATARVHHLGRDLGPKLKPISQSPRGPHEHVIESLERLVLIADDFPSVSEAKRMLLDLCDEIAREPKHFVKGDHGMQNVALEPDGVRLYDFESARLGLRQTDLANFLAEPSLGLGQAARRAAVKTYLAELAALGHVDSDDEEFLRRFDLACVVRGLAQASKIALGIARRGYRPTDHRPASLYLQPSVAMLQSKFTMVASAVRLHKPYADLAPQLGRLCKALLRQIRKPQDRQAHP